MRQVLFLVLLTALLNCTKSKSGGAESSGRPTNGGEDFPGYIVQIDPSVDTVASAGAFGVFIPAGVSPAGTLSIQPAYVTFENSESFVRLGAIAEVKILNEAGTQPILSGAYRISIQLDPAWTAEAGSLGIIVRAFDADGVIELESIFPVDGTTVVFQDGDPPQLILVTSKPHVIVAAGQIAANAPEPASLQLSAGGAFTCAKNVRGVVKCWGRNEWGQLGVGNAQDVGDNANEMGPNLVAVNLGTDRYAKSITTGRAHACAILDNDLLKCWGYNIFGQLGLGHTNDVGSQADDMGDSLPYVNLGTGRTVKQVAAGPFHTCAILDNDRIKCWGAGQNGRLGYGSTDIVGDGPSEMGDDLPYVDLGTGQTAKAILAGASHNCAHLDNDTLKCWGKNDLGQLGRGDSTPAIGDEPGEMGNALAPVQLGTGLSIKSVGGTSSDGHVNCVILDNGTLKCFGINNAGELGVNPNDVTSFGLDSGDMGDNLPAVNLGSGRTAIATESNNNRTCAVLDDGTVKCWGYNYYGALGQGDTSDTAPEYRIGDELDPVQVGSGRSVVSMAVGGYFTCVVLDNNAVKCWGSNTYGMLGLGDTADRGDEPGEMGDNLPSVNLSEL